MKSNRRDIEFSTIDGLILRGWFYTGHGEVHRKSPCVIMASGLAGLKEQSLPKFAERFQAAGYSVLLYDHRNWGASDGLPRNEADPIQQSKDYSDAFDFAASIEDVDEKKIIFWGSSMSGGCVLHAAAFDKRIRAVISQVPFVSGEVLDSGIAHYLPGVYASRKDLKAGGSPELIKLFAETSKEAMEGSIGAMIHDPNIIPFVSELEKQKIPWTPKISPQTLLNLRAFEPQAFVHRIAPTPLLLVAAGDDRCAPTFTQLKAYASAYEPKRLKLLQSSGHFDPYFGEVFEQNINSQLSFLSEIL